jgi:hypothetical protein
MQQFSKFLAEGGAALKTSPITQAEARKVVPTLAKLIADVLGIDPKAVAQVGSAGKRPRDDDVSGDIDFAVATSFDACERALAQLAFDGETFRVMKGINVVSFAARVGDKTVQIDLMPTDDISFVEWSSQANSADLAAGLKGSHRNELFFAVAKHAGSRVLKQDAAGEPLELERYFYDLHRGLLRGKQTREGKRRDRKSFTTVNKFPVTRDPTRITKLLFGPGVSSADVSSFSGALRALMSEKFPWADQRAKIIDTARKGIERKGLKAPPGL